VHLIGAGQGQTIITGPDDPAPQQLYLELHGDGTTVSDLTVKIPPGANSSGDQGLRLETSSNGQVTADHVTVDGSGTDNVRALSLQDGTFTRGTVIAPPDSPQGTTAVASNGQDTVSDSTITGQTGINQSAPALALTVSRTRISALNGIVTDGGTVNVDDTVIDLGSGSGAGLRAENGNNSSTPKTINARHVTIVGGDENSKGVRARAAAPGAQQTSTVNLRDSLISVGGISIQTSASNNGGGLGQSTADVNTFYSNYDPATIDSTVGTNGAGGVHPDGHQTNLAPGFVDAAGGDYRLSPTSPLIDIGDPAPAGPAKDLAGNDRVIDGDANGTAVRDIGAYEYRDTIPPETFFTGGPGEGETTSDDQPVFTFGSDDPQAAFICSVDGSFPVNCSGPGGQHKTFQLADGPHTFSVYAVDKFANADPSPATRHFFVDAPNPPDTRAPKTTITKAPKAKLKKKSASIAFTADEQGAHFECRLDAAAYAPCTSPLTLKRLKRGKHVFSVRATDAAGNVGEPATAKFKVIKKKKH
jgi:hypothetical protein